MRTWHILLTLAVLGLLIGALTVGSTAPAAVEPEAHCFAHGAGWEQFLQGADADGNGTISRDEFAGPDHAFARIDADGDGQITQEEAAASALTRHAQRGLQGRQRAQIDPQERWQRWLEHADADASGTISREEFPAPAELFAKIDADGDGQITQDEALVMPARRAGEGGERGERRGQVGPEARWQRLLEGHDADGNGTISRDEFRGADDVFDRIDADGDGQITQEEAGEIGGRLRGGAGLGRGGPQA